MSEQESTTHPFVLDLQYHTIQGEFVQAVNARMLHMRLGIETNFPHWIARRIEDYGFVREIDYLVLVKNDQNLQGGRPMRDYILTLNMAKELCMLERTEIGRKARRYFLACEHALINMQGLVAQRLEQFDQRLRALEEAQQAIPRADALTPKGLLPAPTTLVREHAEVSWHLAAVWSLLHRTSETLSNHEIAQRTGIATRTARAHTRYLLQLGMLELHETFPRHLYVVCAQAERRNAGVYQRLQKICAVIEARQTF